MDGSGVLGTLGVAEGIWLSRGCKVTSLGMVADPEATGKSWTKRLAGFFCLPAGLRSGSLWMKPASMNLSRSFMQNGSKRPVGSTGEACSIVADWPWGSACNDSRETVKGDDW